jgi:hypothetical protein
MRTCNILLTICVCALVAVPQVVWGAPLGSGFTYQGRVHKSGVPVNDACDFEFSLFEDAGGVTQVGATQTILGVAVVDGLFTVELNSGVEFGPNAFVGDERFLEIAVKCPPDAGFTPLSPLQKLTAAPFAHFALNAAGGTGDGHSLDAADGDPVDALFVDNDGNVGIGTTTPGETLDVAGSIHASGTIASGSSITIDGTAGSEKITSTDALELHSSTGRVLRLTPEAESAVFTGLFAPNILGGFQGNSITAGVVGATVAGGGTNGFENRVTDDWGTVGGGLDNVAGNSAGTTGDAIFATVGGGFGNTASDSFSTVGGGESNTASGGLSTVGGGFANTASGLRSTVGGGAVNTASGLRSTVGGGSSNTASGDESTVPGGLSNVAGGNFSFAAGRRAKANQNGTFVWADSTNADFASTANNQFLIRAGGGVGIGTTSPSEMLHVAGNICATGTIGACSDGRFKEHVEPVRGALAKVAQLRGVAFDWKRDAFPEHRFSEERQVGFIAQEIEPVIPEAVSRGSDGYYSVDYGRLTPVLVEAIKELRAQKDAEIESLRAEKDGEIQELTARLERMERMMAELSAKKR